MPRLPGSFGHLKVGVEVSGSLNHNKINRFLDSPFFDGWRHDEKSVCVYIKLANILKI